MTLYNFLTFCLSLHVENRPFPSCLKPLFSFLSEATCEAIAIKMILYSHANKSHFLNKGLHLASF